MTTDEFSNTFDTLLNSYSIQANFGESAAKQDIVLDEYEKSVLLTQAQDIIVKSYFDRTLNQQAQGFDDSTRRQMDFSSLITSKYALRHTDDSNAYDTRGLLYKCPSDVLFVLNEKLEVFTVSGENSKLKSVSIVVPINYKEYDREMSKAYVQPLKKQCWRLFQKEGTSVDVLSEIIPIEGTIGADDEAKYKIRYVRRPRPIVLHDFSQDTVDHVDVDGVSTRSECELNPVVHIDVLNKAVELALVSRGRMAQPKQNE